MDSYLSHYRCTQCGKEYEPKGLHYLCEDCSSDYRPGMPLKGVLEAMYNYSAIQKAWCLQQDINLFNAVASQFRPPIPVGDTPYFNAPRLAEQLALPELMIKNDALNPSGSFKDRASFMVVADAVQKDVNEIVAASTGNAASSLACIAASVGKKAVIFAPESAPSAKLIQIQVHGAELHKVKGTYDDAFKAALDYSKSHACLCRNTGYHPLTVDGKKSSGLEIFIQNEQQVPDWIVVPVGDGVIITGIYKAFADLMRAGIINRLPRLLAVQAESSDAICSYWESGTYTDAKQPNTIADSISVTTPALAHWAVQAIKDSNGLAIRVSDAEIQGAQLELAKFAGVFAEPSSSATLAGLKKAISQGKLSVKAEKGCNNTIVLLITGHGLKDPASVKSFD
jgi:threonine synthase